MATICYPPTIDSTLEVDAFGITLGDLSVGIPPTGTIETVLERYVELLRMRHGADWMSRTDESHLEVLASVLHEEPAVVRQRLARLA